MDFEQKQELLGVLYDGWKDCSRCKLASVHGRTRQHVVFGEGSVDATVFIVGQSATHLDDSVGSPFQGEQGKVIDMFLSSFRATRNDVFLSYVVADRPTEADNPRKGRKPDAEESAACATRLYAQIEIVDPFVVIALGDVALKALVPSSLKRTISSLAEDKKMPRIPIVTPGRQMMIERAGFATWSPEYLLREWSMAENKPVHQSFKVFEKAFRVADMYNQIYRGVVPPDRSKQR